MSGPENKKNPNRQRLQDEIEYQKKRVAEAKTPEEQEAAKKLLRYSQRTLDAFDKGKKKEKPGFARLPEKSAELKRLQALSTEEKLNLFAELFKEKPLTEKQKVLFLKLSFLATLAQEITKGNIFFLAMRIRSATSTRPYEARQWFEENFQKLSSGILLNEELVIPKDIQKTLLDFVKVNPEALKTEASIYKAYGELIRRLREIGKDYATAQTIMEHLLSDEFKTGKKKLGEDWTYQIQAKARMKISQLHQESYEDWKKAGMTDGQIQEYSDSLLALEVERETNKRIAEHILESKIKIPGQKQEIWSQYKDMLDPKREWFNISDEQWDNAVREFAINAPLIVVSGGVASLARAGLSKAALQILERQGAKLLTNKFAEETLFSKIIAATARKGTGLLVEGAIFDMTHRALTVEMYRDLPDFAKSILWSTAYLGAFHQSSKFSEGLFTKQIGGFNYSTWLGKQTERISDKALREAVKTLALKGHIEMATMLLIGAAQNKAYTGSLDEFLQNIGDEILHAYITVGALKVSGKVISPIMQKFGKGAAQEDERGLATDKRVSQEPGKSTEVKGPIAESEKPPTDKETLEKRAKEILSRRQLPNESAERKKMAEAIASYNPAELFIEFYDGIVGGIYLWDYLDYSTKVELVRDQKVSPGDIERFFGSYGSYDFENEIFPILLNDRIPMEMRRQCLDAFIKNRPMSVFARFHEVLEVLTDSQKIMVIEKILEIPIGDETIISQFALEAQDIQKIMESPSLPKEARTKFIDVIIKISPLKLLDSRKLFNQLTQDQKIALRDRLPSDTAYIGYRYNLLLLLASDASESSRIEDIRRTAVQNPKHFLKHLDEYCLNDAERKEALLAIIQELAKSSFVRDLTHSSADTLLLTNIVSHPLCQGEIRTRFIDYIIDSEPLFLLERENLIDELSEVQKAKFRQACIAKCPLELLDYKDRLRPSLSIEEKEMLIKNAAGHYQFLRDFEKYFPTKVEQREVAVIIFKHMPGFFIFNAYGDPKKNLTDLLPEITIKEASDILQKFMSPPPFIPSRWESKKEDPRHLEAFAQAYKKMMMLDQGLQPENLQKLKFILQESGTFWQFLGEYPERANLITDLFHRESPLLADTGLLESIFKTLPDDTDITFYETLLKRYSKQGPDLIRAYLEGLKERTFHPDQKELILEFLEHFRLLTPNILKGYEAAKANKTQEIFIARLNALSEKLISSKPLSEAEKQDPYYRDLLTYVYQNNSSQWTDFENNDSASDRSTDIVKFKIQDRYVLDLRQALELQVKEGQKLDEKTLEGLKKEILDIQLELRDTEFEPEKMQAYFEKQLTEMVARSDIPKETMDSLAKPEEKLFLLTLDALTKGKDLSKVKRLMILYEFSYFQDIRNYIQGTTDRVSKARNPEYALLAELHNFFGDQIKEVFRKIVHSANENEAIRKLLPRYFQEIQAGKAEQAKARMQISKLGLTDAFLDQLIRTLKGKTGKTYTRDQMRRIVHLYEVAARGLQKQTTGSPRQRTKAFYGQLRSQRGKTLAAIKEIAGKEFDPANFHIGEMSLEKLLEAEAGIEAGAYDDQLFVNYLSQRFLDVFGDEMKSIEIEIGKFETPSGKGKLERLYGYITKTKESAHARQVGGVCVAGDNPYKAKREGRDEAENQWDMENYFQLVFQDPETHRSQGLVLLHHFTDKDGRKILAASINPSSTYLYSIDEAALFGEIMKTLEQFALDNNFDAIMFSQNKTIRTNRTGGKFEEAIDSRVRQIGKTYSFETPRQFSNTPSYQIKDMDVVWEKPSK